MNNMKKKFFHTRPSLFVLYFLLGMTSAHAQCPMVNTAFNPGEELNYQLYFNWKFIWIKAGTANLSIQQSKYDGRDAYRCHLITRGSKRTDKFFMMRDTLVSYITPQLEPLYYRKGALEGKRYNVDEVWYSYPGGGKVQLKQRFINWEGNVRNHDYSSTECVFDMVSMLMRARSFDPASYKDGQRIRFKMADGDNVSEQTLIYRGRKKFKMEDTGVTYRCLVFSFVERVGKKDKEVVTFYITDDMNHMPVRLDLFLNFGTAKAFLCNHTPLRNPQTSIIQ